MSSNIKISFKKFDLTEASLLTGAVVCFLNDAENDLDFSREVNLQVDGILENISNGQKYSKLTDGELLEIPYLGHESIEALIIVKNADDKDLLEARRIGAKLADLNNNSDITIFSSDMDFLSQIIFGFELKSYSFDKYKSSSKERKKCLNVLTLDLKSMKNQYKNVNALIEGIAFTRDLTNEPSNILNTIEFSERLHSLQSLGVKIKVLEELELKKLGMNALLGVGQGSPSPSKVIVMEWNRVKKQDPLVVVGKGVVFDTGGISLKPAAGMEAMTIDMGGAGVVAGLMKTIALRKAKVNVVGVVGLVENMPDGNAQRPGDIVRSMKGDTIEVINTDAEGRLVLCDLLWYVQKQYRPKAIIDLATLTGAIIVALGNDKAGVFTNNQVFAEKFLECALEEDEGAWQMPLDSSYDKQLKSNIADIKNVGGRPANSITAARFLQRFVKNEIPWIHLDIAGVVSTSTGSTLSPKGATGWGVKSLNKLIEKYF